MACLGECVRRARASLPDTEGEPLEHWVRAEVPRTLPMPPRSLAQFSLGSPPRGAAKSHLRDARVPVRENVWSESSPAPAGTMARRAEAALHGGTKAREIGDGDGHRASP
jgi:hypothetical protein